MAERALRTIALIGYGEVGSILGNALVERRVADVVAYDILADDAQRRPALAARAAHDGVRLVDSPAAATAQAELVISAVTAQASHAAAMRAAQALAPGAYYLDLNSASPATKQRSGAVVAASGGRYVEGAVMTSVPPYGIAVPILLGGPDAAELQPQLTSMGFAATVASPDLGVASAIKMCRSIVIKGMEALFVESLLCARHHGVEQPVLDSLVETFPGIDWDRQGSYFWSRVVQHGRRRAEEMREAASMVREDGFEPLMAAATAERQAKLATMAAEGLFADVDRDEWRALADRVLAASQAEVK
jgi:3-hydroxyisobutyrate dehydrogenase-like beta-hydroxyacid dehydrogenase